MMGRPSKPNHPVTVRMAEQLYDRLGNYCDETGVPKTVAIEKAVAMYLDDYDKKQEQLASLNNTAAE